MKITIQYSLNQNKLNTITITIRNFTLLSPLATTLAITTATAISNTSPAPPPALSQLAQDLPSQDNTKDRECNWRGILSIHNGCSKPLHVWRQDASVDKATVINGDGEWSEPLRKNWRSGFISYRLSYDNLAPYTGKRLVMFSYYVDLIRNRLSVSIYDIFGRYMDSEGEALATVGMGGSCTEGSMKMNKTSDGRVQSLECQLRNDMPNYAIGVGIGGCGH